MSDYPLIFVVAGEPSGDVLGGRLMAGLKRELGDKVVFAGVGGPRMLEQGLVSLFPMSDMTVMGLAEVVPRIPLLLRRIRETAEAALKSGPAVVVTIDAPDFSFRVAKKLRGHGIPLVHYVAPTVWAWRPGRARKVAALVDHLLLLLPFEPPYFDAVGLANSFVGHPVVESGCDRGQGGAFRARHGIGPEDPLLCVLPGSRGGEISRLLPPFGETVARLARERPNLRVAVPTVAHVADRVREATDDWAVPVTVIEGLDEKHDAFAASTAALAASGTVAVELAMAGLPAVIGYRVHPLSAAIARRLIKVRFANLINIVLDREVVPELIQENCIVERLTAETAKLLDDPAARKAQTDAVGEALKAMGRGGPSPSLRAARAVIDVMNGGKDV